MGFYTLLCCLIIIHFGCDYIFQGSDMAIGKGSFNKPHVGVPWYYWLTAHAGSHAFAVGLATQSLFIGLVEFICHFFIDICKSKGWINIHIDQLLHLSLKLLYAALVFRYLGN